MLAVQSEGSFVGFEGEKAVSFTGGGWCVQRGLGVSAESEGLLRFWLDCSSGASKGDVAVILALCLTSTPTFILTLTLALTQTLTLTLTPPHQVDAGERIFFSTGVWDDAEEVRRMV